MKKHPIDKVFANNLRDLAREPSANAWAMLEANLQAKRNRKRQVTWLSFAAAATVALLVVSLLWLNQPPQPRVAVEVIKPKKQENSVIQSQITPESPAEKSFAGTPDQSVSAREKEIINERKSNALTANRQREKVEETKQKKTVDKLEIQPVEPTKPTLAISENTPELPKPEAISVTPTMSQPTVVVMVQIDAASQSAVTESTGLVKEPEIGKESKAGKLFAKLKKLKKGEFEELGIHPDQLFAFAKDKDKKNAD